MEFTEDQKIQWYRTPIDRDRLRDLMQRNDLKGWRQTLLHLGWFITTAAASWWAYTQVSLDTLAWSLPLLLLALFVHGTMGPFMGLIAIHELQHRTVFKSRFLNEFFEKIYAFISWSDYIWYQQSHTQHHMSTCHAQHDGEVVLPVRFSLRKPKVWLNLLAWDPRVTWAKWTLTWRHAKGDIRGDWYQHVLPASDVTLRRRHSNWARFLIVGHATLALIFVLSGNWFLIVVFTIGTQYCAWLGFLCGVPQHHGLNSDIPDFRQNTRTFTCSWLPAFYYWNMQYHLEHHMYPAVPFHALPALRAEIEYDLPPATHGLWATWRQMLGIKEKMLADPQYRFIPPLPQTANKFVS